LAQINQERAKQIYEKQTRKLQDLVQDAETDEYLLAHMEEERSRLREREIQKKMENLQGKYILQQQMRDREKQKEESQAEYLRDKKQVDAIVRGLIQEDLNQMEEDRKKKEMLRSTMHEAYEEKTQRKQQSKEDERLQKEKERQYFEEVAKREREQQAKRAIMQEEKDRIFEKLTADAERKQAEKDYWETVRNDLHIEEQNRRDKIKGLQEMEKRQR
jgi:hypothetical protein